MGTYSSSGCKKTMTKTINKVCKAGLFLDYHTALNAMQIFVIRDTKCNKHLSLKFMQSIIKRYSRTDTGLLKLIQIKKKISKNFRNDISANNIFFSFF